MEKRTIFSEETIKYQEIDAPELLLYNVKLEDEYKGVSRAYETEVSIKNCLKKDSYNQSIDCIEKVTFSKEKYLPTVNHNKGI